MLLGSFSSLDLFGFPLIIFAVDNWVLGERLLAEVLATMESFSLLGLSDLFINDILNKHLFSSLSFVLFELLQCFEVLLTLLLQELIFIDFLFLFELSLL